MSELTTLEALLGLAAQEAQAAKHTKIFPVHLLIALSRLSEQGGSGMPANELCEEFALLGIEPKKFRRRLRAILGPGRANEEPEGLHRSPACREIFQRAATRAAQEGVAVGPVHLLHEIFASLGPGEAPSSEAAESDDGIPDEL